MKTADANTVGTQAEPDAGVRNSGVENSVQGAPETAPADPETAAGRQLEQQLQMVTARRAGLALGLWGEAGIGKSHRIARLLRALPCRSLSLHASAPISELLRAMPRPARLPLLTARVLDRLAQGEGQPVSAAADALAAVLSRLSPFVLHLEDLQGAGPERLELLEALAGQVVRLRGVALLVSSRRPPPGAFAAVRQHPLSARQSRELLEAEAGAELPPEALIWVYERAAGNPLFTLEYFRLLARQGHLWNDARRWHWRAPPQGVMPVTVEALIERVLGRVSVPGPLPDLLAAKAMLPRDASRSLTAAVAGRTPEEARLAEAELERLGILARGEFAHPLYREVSLKMLGADRFGTGHGQLLARRALKVLAHDPELAASFLEGARLAPAPSLALLEQAALAAERAGRSAQAAALWVRAADQAAGDHGLPPERQAGLALQAARASETIRPGEALRLARRAAELRPDDPETALYLAGRLVQHSRRLSDAEEVLNQLPPEVRSGPLWVSWQLGFLVSCGQYAEALTLWDAAALVHGPGAENTRSGHLTPGMAYSVAACLVQTGQPERAAQMARQGLDHPDTTPTQRASLLNVASIACAVTDQPQEAEAHLEAALDLARAHGLSQLRGALLQNRTKNLERTERFADALAAAQESFVAYAEAGDSLRHANAGVLVAGHLSESGRFEEAETLLQGSLEVLERQGTSRFLVVALTTLASLYLDWQPPHGAVLALKLARSALEQARLLGPGSGREITAFALAALARAAAWAGDPLQALACAQEAVSCSRQATDESAFLALAALAAAHLASGHPEQARPVLAEARSAARAGNFAFDLRRLTLEAARLDGDLQLAREQWVWFRSHGLLGGVKLAERAFPELAASGPDHIQTRAQSHVQGPELLHLEVLGAMRLGPPGSTQPVRGRKRRELLAALLEARLRGRPEVSRLDLLDAVYPGAGVTGSGVGGTGVAGSGETQAAASLKELVHLTRAAFGQGIIQTAPDGYMLGHLTSDAEQALGGGDTRLWRGLYLENAALGQRDEAVGEALLLTLHARTEAALTTDPHEAARCARLLLEAEPYSQSALRLGLRALRAAGNHRSLTRLYADAQVRWKEVGETLPERWADFLA